jgi:hypothetical protein
MIKAMPEAEDSAFLPPESHGALEYLALVPVLVWPVNDWAWLQCPFNHVKSTRCNQRGEVRQWTRVQHEWMAIPQGIVTQLIHEVPGMGAGFWLHTEMKMGKAGRAGREDNQGGG